MMIHALWAGMLLVSAAGAATAPDRAAKRIRQVLAEAERWKSPDPAAYLEACLKKPADGVAQPPAIPEDRAPYLQAALDASEQARGLLCGKRSSCDHGPGGQTLNRCEAAFKLDFARSAASGKTDLPACKRLLGAYSEGAFEASASKWRETCDELARDVRKADVRKICSKDGWLGRLGSVSEEEAWNCRFFFRFLGGVEACRPEPARSEEESRISEGPDNCRELASALSARSGGDPKACGGDRLCLALFRDPAACSPAAKPRRARDILLDPDPAACEGDAFCLQAHASAAPYRQTYGGLRTQQESRCKMESVGLVHSSRRARLDALRAAENEVRELARSVGPADKDLEESTIRRLRELGQAVDRGGGEGGGR